ncbi:hypothetical protein [Rhodococcus sp. 24CO]|uniref:hypothetical protein n=1 Tax=Rhodococcus sp. 24CO TaxID=3117460 RepID=UPI003D34CBCC
MDADRAANDLPSDTAPIEPLTNSGTETLFDAVARAPITWTGAGSMCWPTRTVVDPVFRNWSASG